ncbi:MULTISPECIES: hypothetical protein [Bacillus]|uniref:Uncharacterized protein n=1 Tax=Bacillus sonorensis TaxID=119858 RepID=A0ABN5AF33_9BACI|nr:MULTISPECIES: hypothetical protein [Bacillus]ASB89331.1 hypothetical protein S101395_02824 [Bacillus sonorensis]MEC0338356.1 hypothetical protein [Bacillus sonorensis]MEC0425213.1 hypothetical protein [Bacillus sonorensis]MEC0460767.1 hypothetical protein [Bacillus sonorensis]MEC0526422.1 hypothetical protein [Bacillus sonorensis]
MNNNKDQAIEKILSFIESEEKTALMTGTNMFRKHELVFKTITENFAGSRILLRTSSLDNAKVFMKATGALKTGVPYNLNGSTIYIDTVNKRTWDKTPNDFDFVIVYPLKPLTKQTLREELMKDLNFFKNVKKILLVSSQDTFDMSWADEYAKTKIVYDVLEEDSEYHYRVLEDLKKYNL